MISIPPGEISLIQHLNRPLCSLSSNSASSFPRKILNRFVDAALTFNLQNNTLVCSACGSGGDIDIMADGTEVEVKTDEAETVRTDKRDGSLVSVGGQHLEGVPETSGNASKILSMEDDTVNNVKDKRKERLDRLRELHLRRVSQYLGVKQCTVLGLGSTK